MVADGFRRSLEVWFRTKSRQLGDFCLEEEVTPKSYPECYPALRRASREGGGGGSTQDDITALGGVLENSLFQSFKSLRRLSSRDSGPAEFFCARQFENAEARGLAPQVRVAAFKKIGRAHV